ncbi:Gfo/Idh/MocA family protein [Microbacterium sp. NPDC056044]|uniref:Gfo/Idh/MocA family protein n=1 Tax=Microbacterium sp. NPDC056044 TaxID=3345690 RepID=UPI0035DC9F90
MRQVLRWAVIGAGAISDKVVPDLQSIDEASIEVVFARRPDALDTFARTHGIARTCTSYDEVLRDPAVDIVYLATPFATHHDMAKAALRAGKHVLVEKPMGMTAGEVADLFRIASSEDLFLMEAMWTKFLPGFDLLAAELRAGVIGEVRSLRAGFGYPFPSGGSKWDPQRSGGALLDQGIYPVSLAHSLFGEPDRVYAGGVVTADGVDVTVHMTLAYPGGRFAQSAVSIAEYIDLGGSVSGTTGWIDLGTPFWATVAFAHKVLTPTGVETSTPRESRFEGNGYAPMMRAVTQTVLAGGRDHPRHTADETMAVFRTLDRLRASLTEGAYK